MPPIFEFIGFISLTSRLAINKCFFAIVFLFYFNRIILMLCGIKYGCWSTNVSVQKEVPHVSVLQ